MPFGYLVAVVLFGWCAACALWPPRRPATAAWVSFLCGFVLNEVPWVGLCYLLAATVVAFASGGVDGAAGRVVVVLGVAVMAGYLWMAVRASRAGAAVDRALDEGLGAGWRESLPADARAGLRPGFTVGPVSFLPLRARRHDVVRVPDLAYGGAGERNLLDVYHHRSRPEGGSVLIHLHGGALRGGRKNREGLSLIYRLAAHGWVCISAAYRLLPAATWPDPLVDVKKAIAWARAHTPEYGADPAVVFVAGGSAGAQLASLAALTANESRFQPGFEDADTSVAAAVSLYGLYGPRSIGAIGDGPPSDEFPLTHLCPAAPPFFAAHGDRDSLLDVAGAREFVEVLRSVSRHAVVYAELPGAQHAFDRFRSVRCDNVVNAIEAFAAWVRSARVP